MKAIKYSLFAATLLCSAALAAAETHVSHYEPLHGIAIHQADYLEAGDERRQRTDAPAVLSFEAMGRQFDMDLEANDRVLRALPAGGAFDGISVYRGRLANNPDSWVRIVVHDGMPRGLVFDGETMFAIEVPGDSAANITEPVMYRLSDLNILPGTMTCGTNPLGNNAAEVYAGMQDELDPVAMEAAGATSEISMSVIGDSSFVSAQGGDAEAAAAITARFNNIDGYFSEQVGVQLNVEYIETFDVVSDPFDDTDDPGELLDQLSAYRLQSSDHNSRGLTHLYTGRNFASSTVGIAWRGTLCSDFLGAGLSEGTAGLTTASLIAAHEIGHNFGAQHDGEAGSSCENEPQTFIMAPSVTGNEQFSSCSISVMQAEAAAARCVAAIPATDVGIQRNSQASNVLLGASTVVEYEVSVNGLSGVNDVVADFTLPTVLTLDSVTASSGSCTSGAGTATCTLGDLDGLSTHTVTLNTTPSSVGAGMLNASVSMAQTDERPNNDQDAVQFIVNPAVDLVANEPATTPVFVNTSTSVTAMLENRSILDATNVTLSVTLDSGLQADTASWSIGSCTVAAQQIDCQASSFAALSSSTLDISVTALSTGMQDVSVTLASDEVDANAADNSATRAVNVVTPQGEDDDDDDSGGGSTDPLWLLLAALVGFARSRSQLA